MRALVTGGAGFVGSHLVDRLVAGGHAVDVIDDLTTGSLTHLAAARTDAASRGSELKIHTLDVRAVELRDLIARRAIQIVFHLAARPQQGQGLAEVALAGTLNVLQAARASDVTKVVVALDGLALYGEVPARDLPVKEGHLRPPTTVAGAVATSIAALLAGYRDEHAVEYTALALSQVYGPRQATHRGVVAAFAARAAAGHPCVIHGDGRQTRDFVYVDDAVDALVRAAERGSGLVVNVGTGLQTSIRDLHRIVAGDAAPTPVRLPQHPVGPGRFSLSPVRARIHLAWAPWTSLEEGVAAVRGSLG